MAEITRLFDFLHFQASNHPLTESLSVRYKDGTKASFTTQEIIAKANQFSAGLLKLGVKKGDKIALIINQNRPEWIIADIGIQQVGAITVPLYPTLSEREYEFIFKDADIVYCFTDYLNICERVRAIRPKLPTLIEVYAFDRNSELPFWEDILSPEIDLSENINQVKTSDIATIIYTSGTTGNPKGVVLSHSNIVSNIKAVQQLLPISPGEKAISFLPLCHIFEKAVIYCYLGRSIVVTFTGVDNLGGESGDLAAVKPNFFSCVPRLLEKVYEKIYSKGLALTGIKKTLFFWALSLTDDYEYDKEYKGLEKIKRIIADKLIFSKWREALGGNVKGILVGASPLPVKIAKVFSAAGIPVREGYGLTETSPGITFNRFEKSGALLGTVGYAFDQVEFMIDKSDNSYNADEGEILSSGPNTMQGYYKQPEKTAEILTQINGKTWLKTGDIGKIIIGPNGENFLKITDRKKELFKTSGGKYVAPAPIESSLRENFLIEQAILIGDNQKFVSVIIAPAHEALHSWCKEHEIESKSFQEMVSHPKVIAKFQSIIDEINPHFGHVEQIKKFVLVPDTWEFNKSDGTEAELTPTMKLKRRVLLTKYKNIIDNIYA